MNKPFWDAKWSKNELGFHRDDVHAGLMAEADRFLGQEPCRVLVPLCGMSVDMLWLRRAGHHVIGVEWVESALVRFMHDHDLRLTRREVDERVVYEGVGWSLWAADFLSLRPEDVGPCTKVWDRAALVAMEPGQRQSYVNTLRSLAPGGDALVQLLEYDESIGSGPPFSVSVEELRRCFNGASLDSFTTEDLLATEPRWAKRGHKWFVGHLCRLSAL